MKKHLLLLTEDPPLSPVQGLCQSVWYATGLSSFPPTCDPGFARHSGAAAQYLPSYHMTCFYYVSFHLCQCCWRDLSYFQHFIQSPVTLHLMLPLLLLLYLSTASLSSCSTFSPHCLPLCLSEPCPILSHSPSIWVFLLRLSGVCVAPRGEKPHSSSNIKTH